MHFFADPKVGMVQTRWGYLNRHHNVLTEVQAMLLDGHFVLEHVARSGGGLFFNFNGTAGILRKSMIEDAGGWQHDTLTEDSDLSYRAQLKGWKFVYVPSIECLSELPVETYGFQVQQSRWAKGLTQVAMKLLPSILKSDLPFKRQGRGDFPPHAQHLLSADDRGERADAAGDDRALLHGLVGDAADRFAADRGVVLVDFGVSTWSRTARCSPITWKRCLLFLPALMAAGVALTIINSRAVLEALIGYKTELRAHRQVRPSAAAKR